MIKNTIITVLVVAVLGIGAYFLLRHPTTKTVTNDTSTDSMMQPAQNEATTSTTTMQQEDLTKTVIGTSVEGNDIVAYHYGSGDTNVLFVGGVHGGYGANTALVAYELMDYLDQKPEAIPSNVRVTVIPALNPDGLKKIVGTADRFSASDIPTSGDITAGRFNAHDVDLNRNFDCDWQEKGVWQSKPVSGGTSAFSEPESQALQSYIEKSKPSAVVVWYSAGGGVYSSSCHNGVLDETQTLTKSFAKASGYAAHEEFNFYDITGDMVNWLAKEQIPAISVLLTDHVNTEWTKNLAGITAVFKHFAQ